MRKVYTTCNGNPEDDRNGGEAAQRGVIMITDKEKQNMRQFYRAVLMLKDEEECRRFFDDVATIKEVIDLSARFEVARMLDSGAVFSEISRETGASSATISRVNKCLTYGEGGYKTVIDRMKEE